MTGNGNHTYKKNGDDWGMVFIIVLTCFNHMIAMTFSWKSHGSRQRLDRPAFGLALLLGIGPTLREGGRTAT